MNRLYYVQERCGQTSYNLSPSRNSLPVLVQQLRYLSHPSAFLSSFSQKACRKRLCGRAIDMQNKSWVTINTAPITVPELKAYFGFCILMGVNRLPSLNDYWSKDQRLHYAPIADRIPRWRFREISRYLHFVDNDHLAPRGDPAFDLLGKVRPLITQLSNRFAEVYEPSKEVAVDEAMIKFQGRSTLKQYMPMKPIKRGIKVWVLGDSTNGYFSRFSIYTGKGEWEHWELTL